MSLETAFQLVSVNIKILKIILFFSLYYRTDRIINLLYEYQTCKQKSCIVLHIYIS